jgi:WD40 repeat protein
VRGDLAYTRDGALAYTAGAALVLHTATAKAQRTLVVDSGSSSAAAAVIVCAAVTSSGAYAATADAAGAVRVWDVQRGVVVCALPKGLRDCARLAFSGDGKSLAGVDSANDSSICVWETATGNNTVHTFGVLHIYVLWLTTSQQQHAYVALYIACFAVPAAVVLVVAVRVCMSKYM